MAVPSAVAHNWTDGEWGEELVLEGVGGRCVGFVGRCGGGGWVGLGHTPPPPQVHSLCHCWQQQLVADSQGTYGHGRHVAPAES